MWCLRFHISNTLSGDADVSGVGMINSSLVQTMSFLKESEQLFSIRCLDVCRLKLISKGN